MRCRRWLAAVMSVVIGPSLLLAVSPLAGPAHADDLSQIVDQATDSAVTINGPAADPAAGRVDDFSALEITVSQTRGLADQAVTVTWTGAVPTPRGRALGLDYLTMMQCWGPDPDAASFRETCQYGAGIGKYHLGGTQGGSVNGGNRNVGLGLGPDPLETLPADARIVPFRSVSGDRTPHGGAGDPFGTNPNTNQPLTVADVLSPYFNVFTTNEVTGVHTSGDGTGRVVFEVQSGIRAPQLGCGMAVGGGDEPRTCWLVIVPIGHHNQATGENLAGSPSAAVNGSPLSPSNWRYRIPIELEFQPLSGFCPLGQTERRTVGTELVSRAITSWQPVLCADGGPVFGYSEVGDGEAARQVLSPSAGAPGLAFTSDPVLPATGDPAVVHAPVALSAAVIATNIDVNLNDADGPFRPPDEVEPLRATQVRDLRLTPRLVAKLLTQSYQADVPGAIQGLSSADPAVREEYEDLAGSPLDLRHDPEFIALNPVFEHFHDSPTVSSPDSIVVTIGDRVAAREVWRWIFADQPAREWLAGEPDENGMRVNARYAFLDDFLTEGGEPVANFPKADDRCALMVEGVEESGRCTLGLSPYLNTLQEAAYQTLRADEKEQLWDPNRIPPSLTADRPTIPGERFTIAITDAASAARYGLYVAAVRNQAGEFVTPTPDSLRAGVELMVPSEAEPDVLVVDPAAEDPDAYPLSLLTYAAADLSEPAERRHDYALLLRYAAGTGQAPGVDAGELPPGYAPLPAALREQARDAADALELGLPDPPPTSTPPPSGSGGGAPAPDPPASVPNPGASPSPSATPDPGASPTASPSAVPVAQSQPTPGDPAGWLRWVLITVAVVGALGLLAGPLLLLLGQDRPVRATPRQGVT